MSTPKNWLDDDRPQIEMACVANDDEPLGAWPWFAAALLIGGIVFLAWAAS